MILKMSLQITCNNANFTSYCIFCYNLKTLSNLFHISSLKEDFIEFYIKIDTVVKYILFITIIL